MVRGYVSVHVTVTIFFNHSFPANIHLIRALRAFILMSTQVSHEADNKEVKLWALWIISFLYYFYIYNAILCNCFESRFMAILK